MLGLKKKEKEEKCEHFIDYVEYSEDVKMCCGVLTLRCAKCGEEINFNVDRNLVFMLGRKL